MATDTAITRTHSPMLRQTPRPPLSARFVILSLSLFLLPHQPISFARQVESHGLGSLVRSIYFDSSSPSYIEGIRSDIVDNSEVKVRVKAGVEGTVVFDSAIALLQGLFPPTLKNKIVLANETTVVAPLGGYQYVPVETVEPGNDRSLESWTNCPVSLLPFSSKAFY